MQDTILEKVKKIQGISHTEFDDTISGWIAAAKLDLISVGIVNTLVNTNNPDSLIETAIITYVLSFLDVVNSDLYANSYMLQKDTLRHIQSYTKASLTPPSLTPTNLEA